MLGGLQRSLPTSVILAFCKITVRIFPAEAAIFKAGRALFNLLQLICSLFKLEFSTVSVLSIADSTTSCLSS